MDNSNSVYGRLYVVPTPVGNLEDMSPRALRILSEVDLILAEDTRTSGNLLRHFEIVTPLRAHHKYNEHTTLSVLIEQLKSGSDIALVSDAGTPGISDPGFMLSRECRRNGIVVECLPGPTAFVPALVNSGLPCDRFHFEGFLPPKKGRQSRLQYLSELPETIVIYESPLRLGKTLSQLAETFGGEREASVSREISKVHETTYRDTLLNLSEYFTSNQVKGECVIIVAGMEQSAAVRKDKYAQYKGASILNNLDEVDDCTAQTDNDF
ncbi:MAG: 16S rRNA (cytidine(1402)-2'-O)-methyltransferase [Muribaculaceae bacterium]|nr:16S rRNA (cytidine(1402)-2'-O)-methyltransferase [Muribaculaceae bacterium]